MTTTSRARRTRLAAGAIAAAALAGSTLLATGGPADAAIFPPPPPVPGECQLVNFRTATVDPLVSPDPASTKYHLTVTGLLPFPAKVSLEPLVYIRQPEHWGIEVQACPVPQIGPILPKTNVTIVPPPSRFFKATLDFVGPMGSCGIEVIGATNRQSFDLAGPKGCGEIGPAA